MECSSTFKKPYNYARCHNTPLKILPGLCFSLVLEPGNLLHTWNLTHYLEASLSAFLPISTPVSHFNAPSFAIPLPCSNCSNLTMFMIVST